MKKMDDEHINSTQLNASCDVCPTNLVVDAPAENDNLSFSGAIGPHTRVAQALADLIQCHEDGRGRMVGLEGGWGSGKTTVIRLLKKILSDKREITIHSFDAWAHEGDPLRRTYLESLIMHFQNLGWINKEDGDDTLEQLARRRRLTSIQTVRTTTTLGKLYAISAFLVPIGLPLLNAAARKGITFDPDLPISWMFIIGVLLTSSPLLVTLANAIRIVSRRILGKPTNFLDWAFLEGSSSEVTTQNTVETPDPTSIEFEAYFCKLMRSAIPDGADKQAVLVIDNLDRVAVNDALSIWSTLQTFFQDRAGEDSYWASRLWVIVPYDPTGIRKLWDRTSESEGESSLAHAPFGAGSSFLDKSFQLRFEVPPPVLSNWKQYLITISKHAFPKHPDEDHLYLYRVFSMCRDRHGAVPTPRELKLFINQVGVIHRQWQDSIPLGHIAYYAWHIRYGTDVRGQLLSGSIPDKYIVAALPPGLHTNLAGLLFNVDPAVGQQLLLETPILDALTTNQPEKLDDLEKQHGVGFWAVAEEAVNDGLKDVDATDLALSAACLEKSGILEKRSKKKEVENLVAGVRRAALEVKYWGGMNADIGIGLASIIRRSMDNDARKIISSINDTLEAVTKDGAASFPLDSSTSDALKIIFSDLKATNRVELISSNITLPMDIGTWIEQAPLLETLDEELLKLLTINHDVNEIRDNIFDEVEGFTENHVAALKVANITYEEREWEELVGRIVVVLSDPSALTIKVASNLLEALFVIRRLGSAAVDPALTKLSSSGHLLILLKSLHDEGALYASAICVAAHMEKQPNADIAGFSGAALHGHQVLSSLLAADDEDFARTLLSVLKENNNLDLILDVWDAREEPDPLIIRMLRILVDDRDSRELLTHKVIVERWEALMSILPEDGSDRFNKLLHELCEEENFIEFVEMQPDGFKSSDAGLYLILAEETKSKGFHNWVVKWLEKSSSEEWTAAIECDNSLLDLLFLVLDANVKITLKIPFVDALIDNAKKLVSGSVELHSDLVDKLPVITKNLSRGALSELQNNIIDDVAIKSIGKLSEDFFTTYGGLISNATANKNGYEVVTRLLSPLVKEKSIPGMRWLSQSLSENKELFKKHTDRRPAEGLTERIKSEMVSDSKEQDEHQGLINTLGNLLGLSPPKSDEEEGVV